MLYEVITPDRCKQPAAKLFGWYAGQYVLSAAHVGGQPQVQVRQRRELKQKPIYDSLSRRGPHGSAPVSF